jgi:hypothetical protein
MAPRKAQKVSQLSLRRRSDRLIASREDHEQRAPDHSEEGTEQIVSDMNELAGKSPSARRARQAHARTQSGQAMTLHVPTSAQPTKLGSSSRPTAGPQQTVGGQSSKRKQNGLKRLTKGPPETGNSRRQGFELPEDSDDEASGGDKRPAKKRLKRAGATVPNPSPLKGHSVIPMPTDGRVNLDDHPSPLRSLGRPRKPDTHHKPGRPNRYGAATAASPSRALVRETSEAEETDQIDEGAERQLRQQDDLESDDVDADAAASRRGSTDSDDEDEAAAAVADSDQQDGPEPEEQDEGTAEGNQVRPHSSPPPPTQGENRAQTIADQQAARRKREEPDRERYRAEYRPYCLLHNCEESWLSLLTFRDAVRIQRPPRDPENGEIHTRVTTIALRRIERATELYQADAFNADEVERMAFKIEERISNIQEVANPRQNAMRGKDLYYFIIPEMITAIAALLLAIRPTSQSAIAEITPLVNLLNHALLATDKAMDWHPRPSTLAGRDEILRRTRLEVRGAIAFIRDSYQRHIRRFDRAGAFQQYNADNERRVAAARKHAEDAQRAKLAIIEESRRRAREALTKQRPSLYGISLLSQAQNGLVVRLQPRAQPEEPEDIYPPPNNYAAWSRAEQQALLHSLTEYKGPNRFEEILAEHGEGALHGRTLDDVRSQAIHIKRVFMSSKEKPGDYSWLTSIPDIMSDGT